MCVLMIVVSIPEIKKKKKGKKGKGLRGKEISWQNFFLPDVGGVQPLKFFKWLQLCVP